MAIIGFKQYSDKDRYASRRAVNKGMNVIWKIIVTIVVAVGLVFLVIHLIPWGNTLNKTINGANKYEGVPSFYK